MVLEAGQRGAGDHRLLGSAKVTCLQRVMYSSHRGAPIRCPEEARPSTARRTGGGWTGWSRWWRKLGIDCRLHATAAPDLPLRDPRIRWSGSRMSSRPHSRAGAYRMQMVQETEPPLPHRGPECCLGGTRCPSTRWPYLPGSWPGSLEAQGMPALPKVVSGFRTWTGRKMAPRGRSRPPVARGGEVECLHLVLASGLPFTGPGGWVLFARNPIPPASLTGWP